MASNIRCTANDCEYWSADNYCTAESILVVPSAQLQIQTDHHGDGAEKLPAAPAGAKAQTHCYTFEKE